MAYNSGMHSKKTLTKTPKKPAVKKSPRSEKLGPYLSPRIDLVACTTVERALGDKILGRTPTRCTFSDARHKASLVLPAEQIEQIEREVEGSVSTYITAMLEWYTSYLIEENLYVYVDPGIGRGTNIEPDESMIYLLDRPQIKIARAKKGFPIVLGAAGIKAKTSSNMKAHLFTLTSNLIENLKINAGCHQGASFAFIFLAARMHLKNNRLCLSVSI